MATLKTGPPADPVEWHKLLTTYRTSSIPPESSLIESAALAVSTIPITEDTSLSICLLAFIQDNASILDDDTPRLKKAFDAVISLVKPYPQDVALSSSMIQLKIQVPLFFHNHSYLVKAYMTATTLVVQSTLIEDQPASVEAFVEILLGVASKLNSGHDRMLRAAAHIFELIFLILNKVCQCLRELELSHQGLLLAFLGRMYDCIQKETVHPYQDYILLFLTLLRHAIHQVSANYYLVGSLLKLGYRV